MTEVEKRSSTARSRELGEELRRARVRAGMSGTGLAEALGWSAAKVSKLEKGWRGTSEWEIGVLLGCCGADKAVRERVRRFACEVDVGWFVRAHGEESVDELAALAVHESAALTIECYEPLVVPALAQSPAYARALSGCEPVARLRRQSALRAVAAFYVHEAALRLAVGDALVMREQVLKLLRLEAVRVVPFSAGGHWALRFPSTVMTFDQGIGPVVCVEADTATVFLDDERAVRIHQEKHAVLDRVALSVERSRELLVEVL